MVAAMMRHMMSLRRLQRDYGWIHTLLEEAENERMHLMTALQLRQPSMLFRLAVIGSQGEAWCRYSFEIHRSMTLFHTSGAPPKTEYGCLHGGVKSHTRKSPFVYK
ncbi:uncharacterized protein LOC143279326 [Babylonia areolata]|uniref:uncharacterized protein LOC143279326 n=1 Tax=Babylonia areolata TaxID=304850 RepID=UPI003FD27423